MRVLGQRLSYINFTLCYVALVAIGVCANFNECRADDADSGWAISSPPTLAPQVKQTMPIIQIPRNRSTEARLLEDKQPILRIEVGSVEPKSTLRLAERPSWQPNRPNRSETNLGLDWAASNLSDFRLTEQSTAETSAPNQEMAAPEAPAPPSNVTQPSNASQPAEQIAKPVTQPATQKSVEFAAEETHPIPSSKVSLPNDSSPSNEAVDETASDDDLDIGSAPLQDAQQPVLLEKRPQTVVIEEPDSMVDGLEAASKSAQLQTKQQENEASQVPAEQADRAVNKETSDKPNVVLQPSENRSKPRVATPKPVPVAKPLTPLSRNQQRLRTKVRNVLKAYYRRPLNSRDHDPWEIMHGMLAYGAYSRVLQGGPSGEPITAVGWLCYNRPSKRQRLLHVNKAGELRARWGVGLQGHYGQFLAMLAQSRVAQDYPIRVDGREFTVADLIAAEQKTCQPGEELSFKLISLMHYCPSDIRWMNDQGSEWTIPRLIQEELKQPIRGAPCGGTHRLSGLSLAVRTRAKRGEPLDGEYRRAHEFVERYERYALQFQNSDGSLSTEWFRGRGDDTDINRRIKTTGHILEWLLYSQTDDEVASNRTFRAVNYLASLMSSNFDHDWEIGPLAHATHALVLYDERVFQPYDGLEQPAAKRPIASQPQQRNRQRRRQNVSSKSKRRR